MGYSIDTALRVTQEAIDYATEIGYYKGKAYAYINYARCIVKKGFIDSCEYYSELAVSIFRKIEDNEGIFEVHSTLGRIYTGLMLSEKATENYIEAMKYIEYVNNKNSIIKLYNFWGLLNIFWSDYEKAQQIIDKSLPYLASTKDKEINILSGFIRGVLYIHTKEYSKSLYYLYEAQKLSDELKSDYYRSITDWYISFSYTESGDYSSAASALLSSLEISERCRHYEQSAITLTSLGHLASIQGDYRKELYYSKKSLEKRHFVGDVDLITSSYINIGKTYLNLGVIDTALIYADSARVFTSKLSTIRYAAALYSLYYRAFQAKGDYSSAIAALLRYSTLKDTLFNQDVMKNMTGLQLQFESQVRDKLIAETNAEQQIAVITILLAICLLSAFFIFFLKKATKKKRQLGAQLNNQNEFTNKAVAELNEKKRELEVFQDELEFRISDSTAGLEKEIAERKKAELLLMESEEKYRTLVDNIQDGTYIIRNGKFYFANVALSKITGIDSEAFYHKTFYDITLPLDHAIIADLLSFNPFDDESNRYFEFRIQSAPGGYKNVIARKPSFVKVSNELSAVGSLSDITHYREIERQLEISVQEKVSLINEIHMRVKNNLMIISNLLNSQCQTLDDETIRSLFAESINRIRAIAIIHNKLYITDKQQKVLTSEYIESISSLLFESYNTGDDLCETELEIDDFLIEIEKAIPIGLIISELVSNSFKYAISSEKQGFIRVALKNNGNDRITLEVSDNGSGIPDGVKTAGNESFGHQLIGLLVSQLHGELIHFNDNGAHFLIKFSI